MSTVENSDLRILFNYRFSLQHEWTVGRCFPIFGRVSTDQVSGQDALVDGNGLGARDDHFGR